MIYFAQLPSGAVKIGKADDVDARLVQLEQQYRQPLSLLHVMEGSFEVERQIHRRFRHLRIEGGRGREQFRPAPDLMEFIGRPLLVSPNPDAVEAVEAVGLRENGHGLMTVRLEAPLVKKAQAIAREQGMPVSQYLSSLLQSPIRREWNCFLRRLVEEDGKP